MTAQFEAVRTGEYVRLSPNLCLCAAVHNGLRINVWTHVHMYHAQLSPRGNSGGGTAGKGRSASPLRAEAPHMVCSFQSLDVVDQLEWSPDSTLLALLESKRHVVEVWDVYGKQSIARIDAGLNGVHAILWHPSSRAIYWFGLCDAFLVSLVDGESMEVVPNARGVKSSWRRESNRRSLTMIQVLMPDATPAAGVAELVAAARQVRVPLLDHSPCRKWVFAVTPRKRPILLSEEVAPLDRLDAAHVLPPWVPAISATQPLASTASLLIPPSSSSSSSAVVSQQRLAAGKEMLQFGEQDADVEEHLTILDSTTFSVHASVPIAPNILRSVTSMTTLMGGVFLFHDCLTSTAVLVRISASSSSPIEKLFWWCDVNDVVASASRGTVALACANWSTLRTLLFVEGQYHDNGSVDLNLTASRLQYEVCASLQEQEELPPLAASDISGTATAKPQQGSASRHSPRTASPHHAAAAAAAAVARVSSAKLSRYTPVSSVEEILSAAAEVRAVPRTVAARIGGLLAISGTGTHVAVSPPLDQRLVLVIHACRRQVHTVLRHVDPVTALSFSDTAASFSVPLQAVSAATRASPVAAAVAPANPPKLAITTDNHFGRVFLWTEASASVLTIPLDRAMREAAVVKEQDAAVVAAMTLTGERYRMARDGTAVRLPPLSFYVAQLLWGAGGTSLVLVDKDRGVFTTAQLQP